MNLDRFLIIEASQLYKKVKKAVQRQTLNRIPYDDLTMFMTKEYKEILEGMDEINNEYLSELQRIVFNRLRHLSQNKDEINRIHQSAFAEEQKKFKEALEEDKKNNKEEYDEDLNPNSATPDVIDIA